MSVIQIFNIHYNWFFFCFTKRISLTCMSLWAIRKKKVIGKGVKQNYMKRHTYQTKWFHIFITLELLSSFNLIVKIRNEKLIVTCQLYYMQWKGFLEFVRKMVWNSYFYFTSYVHHRSFFFKLILLQSKF